MAKGRKPKKGSFIVTMRCEVTKSVIVDGCTEEEARTDPWNFAIDEREVEQQNWEVLSVKENT